MQSWTPYSKTTYRLGWVQAADPIANCVSLTIGIGTIVAAYVVGSSVSIQLP